MRHIKRALALILIIYLLPSLAAAALWATKERPANWRAAKWTTSGQLPDPGVDRKARVAILAASTGGFKGAFAVHSWIVIKPAGARTYDRYDVVGWGMPVRKNGYAADGFWYSNRPQIVWQAEGEAAEALIGPIEAAISAYPHNRQGGYRMYPGPNSNTFVASVMRAVPEIDAVLPPNAVGRDYHADGSLLHVDPTGDAHLTLYGLAGLSLGHKSGIEFHLFGLVAGLDLANPGLKVPAFGRLGI